MHVYMKIYFPENGSEILGKHHEYYSVWGEILPGETDCTFTLQATIQLIFRSKIYTHILSICSIPYLVSLLCCIKLM